MQIVCYNGKMGTKRASNSGIEHKTTDTGIRPPASGAAAQGAVGQSAAANSNSAAPNIDELDTSIVRHLERHGRATNYEVGEAVGLSASAASRRIQALEASGAIRGYRAVVDERLLGKPMTVYIRITLERQSALVLAAFETAVRRCHDIVSCHLMAGQYDYMLVARVAGIDDYNRLHQNELSRLPGVTRLETSFALRDVMVGKG